MKKIFKVDNIAATSKRKLRVAAYARVSTDSDEQLVSLKAQKEHYDKQTGFFLRYAAQAFYARVEKY